MNPSQSNQAREAKGDNLAAVSSAVESRSLLRAAHERQTDLIRQLAALRSQSFPQETLALLLHQQNLQSLYRIRVLGSLVDPPALALPSLPWAGLNLNQLLLQGSGTIPAQSLTTPVALAGTPLFLPSAATVTASSAAAAGAGTGGWAGTGYDLAAEPAEPPSKRTGRSSVFPHMLHDILTDLERQGRADIASFLPHGRAFAIHKPREWANSVMPKHFRGSHFSSFQRQLNLYNFQRITSGVDKGAYFHPLFIRDRRVLCKMMRRCKIKGVKAPVVGASVVGGTREILEEAGENSEGDPDDPSVEAVESVGDQHEQDGAAASEPEE